MNRVSMTLACAAALLFAVQPALAEADLESEFAKMRELVEGLQQKVEAQEEQIEHQSEMLEQAQTAVQAQQEQAESLSGLSTFLDSVEVDGHFAGSYNYNFNTPKHSTGGADLNNGLVGALPFHGDHNTMSVDQIWFGIGKPATEESPAGFRFDILYGNNANFLGQGTGGFDDPNLAGGPYSLSRRAGANDSTSDYYIAQAYAEYTADVGEGLNFKFGKWQTMVGAEVVQATGNFNITRGIVYSLLQPVDHLGLLGTLDVGPVEIGAAVVNAGSSSISSPDINSEKSYIATAALGDDRMSLRTSFIYGAEDPGDNETRTGLADVTAWFNPTENVSLWANYNYLYVEATSGHANGIALAGRVQLTDKIGAALRGEYVNFRDSDSGITEFYTLTGTADYALTDHLLARAEVRFDTAHDDKVYFRNGSTGDPSLADNQTVGLVEVVYEF
ncbi:MAG: outer membrane beta-barrel protein [Deltaproteobacteria bacterium]|jgi:hypothetical protein|nr:outer membrane beta-barrel protein [Deltaproteobacteria bacterium]MBW2534217.1 outer membrane beta-barrel protein [Deltaproteobacteria bacterium]